MQRYVLRWEDKSGEGPHQQMQPTLIHDGIVFTPGLVALEYWRTTHGPYRLGKPKPRHTKCNIAYVEWVEILEE